MVAVVSCPTISYPLTPLNTPIITGIWLPKALLQSNHEIHRSHRKELQEQYKKFDTFNNKFEIDEQMLADIRAAADKEKIEFNEEQYNKSLPLIKTQLKASVARSSGI